MNRFFELFEEFLSSHDGSKNSNEANKWEKLQAAKGESNLVISDYSEQGQGKISGLIIDL